MPDIFLLPLTKVLLPAFAIAMMLFVAKRRKLSLANDLGFRSPVLFAAIGFLVAWLGLVSIEEVLTASVESANVKAWPTYTLLIVSLRILAIGVLGPIAEELAFRGLLMTWLRRTKLGIFGAIFISAAAWSLMHLQYAPILLLLIFIDGLVLGSARHFCRSIYVPIAMHIAGNLFSIFQSLNLMYPTDHGASMALH
jgi:membrane protease YdiL (CAAX protease family)